MAGTMRLRLKDGAREIEVEGEKDDIVSLLDKYWTRPAGSTASFAEEPDNDGGNGKAPEKKKKSARRARKASTEKKEAAPSDPDLEPHVIANKIKDNAQYDLLRRKVLNVRGEAGRKASLILWIAEKPMTSGQVHRALGALDIKVTWSTISEALKGGDYITTGQRGGGGAPAGYRLTAPAKERFEEWLTADGS
jgi:hypothetical protein